MFSWMNPKLEVRQTDRYGRGVFAKELVAKGEMLFVMGGYILTTEDDNALRGEVADKGIEISEKFMIGPRSPEDLERMPEHYVNHSCDPNAGFKGQIIMVALRKILASEEVTYDYAMVSFPDPESNTFFRMECLCGSRHCRGWFAEDDWEIPELQERYSGYFQWYLEEKIRRRRSGEEAPPADRSYRNLPSPWEK